MHRWRLWSIALFLHLSSYAFSEYAGQPWTRRDQTQQQDNCTEVIGVDASSMLQVSDPLALVGVKGISYSIGYSVSDSFLTAKESELPNQGCSLKMAKIVNRAGIARYPNAEGAQAAVRSTNFNDPVEQQCPGIGLCANVWDKDQDDVYPISFLAYVVVPTIIPNQDCDKMKLVYDFLKWAITDPQATEIAVHHDYASLPVKFAQSVLANHLNTMKCANDDNQTTFRPIMNEPPTSKALVAHGTGSNMMQGLIYALLNVYSGAGISTVSYDGSMGTGAGLCQLTVGTTSCWFNQTSRETVACAVWDSKKTTCLAAGPWGPRTAFAGAPSIVEMRSRTVQRQGQRMIPLFAAAIGVVYNLPSVSSLVLSREATNLIFLGQVSAWNHPLIQATNPGVVLPARRIVRFVRSDNAAATQILVRALASFANTENKWGTTTYWLQHPLRGSATPTWPPANSSAASAAGAQCVVEHCGRSICPVGKFFVPAKDICQDCQPGTYMDSVGQPLACTPCPAGHFGDAWGAAACSTCDEGAYQPLSGQTACDRCPANTRRFLVEAQVQLPDGGTAIETSESPGVSRDECKCVPGFWLPLAAHGNGSAGNWSEPFASTVSHQRRRAGRRTGMAPGARRSAAGGGHGAIIPSMGTAGGEACVPCPPGAVCAGFHGNVQTAPSPLPGYWGDPAFPWEFHECAEAEACEGGYACGEGRHGRLCEEALEGYFIVGHKWFLKCPRDRSAAAVLTVLLSALVIFVWLNIMRLAETSVHESIDISAKFLHLLSFIAEFRLRWHPYLDPIVLVLLIVNVEVDFVGPQCIWPSFDGVELFYFQLAVPFVITGISTLCWWLRARFCRTRITLQRALANPVLNKMLIRDGTIAPSGWRTVLIQQGLACFGFMYQVLSHRALTAYACTAYPDGRFLTEVPDIACGSDVHTGMLITSSLYIALVIVALPIALVWVLLKGRAENRLTDPHFLQCFGTCYEQYRVECVWWEGVLLLRKLCISAILALVDLPMIQGALAILLLYLSIWFHLSHLPFVDRRHNILEAGCLFCAMVYVICGMIFYPSLNSSPLCVGTASEGGGECASTGEIKKTFSMVLVLLVILTVGLAIASALWEVYERRQSRAASDYIASKEPAWSAVNRFLSAEWMGEKSFRSLIPCPPPDDGPAEDEDEDEGTTPVPGHVLAARRFSLVSQAASEEGGGGDLKSVQLHLSHMLDGCFLASWKDWLVDMTRRSENIRLKYGLRSGAAVARHQIRVYSLLDEAIPRSASTFRGALSLSSNSNLAGMAVQLLAVFPGFVDFLLTTSDELRAVVFDFFADYLRFSAAGPPRPFAKWPCERAVAPEYHSVTAHWLLVSAGEAGAARFGRLVRAVCRVGRDGGPVDGGDSALALRSALRSRRSQLFTELDLKAGFRKCSLETCERLRSSQERLSAERPRSAPDGGAADAPPPLLRLNAQRLRAEGAKVSASLVDLTPRLAPSGTNEQLPSADSADYADFGRPGYLSWASAGGVERKLEVSESQWDLSAHPDGLWRA